MTDQNFNSTVSNESVANQGQNASTSYQQEEVVPKSYMNKIIGERYNHGYEKGYQEALAKASAPQSNVAQSPSDPRYSELNSKVESLQNQLKENEEKQKAEKERTIQEQQKAQMQTFANKIAPKIEEGKKKYEDFNSVVNIERLEGTDDLVLLAGELDNTADVLYNLLKTPERLGNILAIKNQRLRFEALSSFSKSIKNNQASANLKVPRESTSQIQASDVKASSGELTLGDLRRQYRH